MKPYISLSAGQNEVVANFVARTQGRTIESWGKYNTLAFYDKKGMKCALVYNHWTPPNIAMHIAARPGSLWCHPAILFHIFAYPFLQLKLGRVTAPVAASNERSIAVVEHLGYKLEGRLREADPRGGDILVFGMLKTECRWLDYQENNENSLSFSAPAVAGRPH